MHATPCHYSFTPIVNTTGLVTAPSRCRTTDEAESRRRPDSPSIIVKYPIRYSLLLQISALPTQTPWCSANLARRCSPPSPASPPTGPSSPLQQSPPPSLGYPLSNCPMPPTSDSARATTLPTSYRDSTLAVFALLLALRTVNAWTLRSFFQPDEFFQSLEPAWQLAFGDTAHACITWVNFAPLPLMSLSSQWHQEWRTQLRSSLHPALFAAVYRVAAHLAGLCGLTLAARAELLIAAPKLAQAVFAALLDCYTWKLAHKVHGPGSRVALTAVGSRPAGSSCQSLISAACVILACIVRLQPVAMVLLNADPVQLP